MECGGRSDRLDGTPGGSAAHGCAAEVVSESLPGTVPNMNMQMNDMSDDLHFVSAPIGLVATPYRPGIYRNSLKRFLDIFVVVLSSAIIVPLILLLVFVVAASGHSPFYLSDRVGQNGRTFRMLKLRTMVPNADEIFTDYLDGNAAAKLEWDQTQKLKFDPRITRIGRFLRKSSLDELPQLWNVLSGDMSLVGPRPMMPSQRGIYPSLAYYGLRPGLTGLWQISDRNDCSFSKRAEFDSAYESRVTFFGDIVILLKTVGVVAKGTGY